MRPFFDTNVLVYAFDEGEPEKREVALALIKEHLEEGDGILSVQVLREFYVSVRRLSRPLSAADVMVRIGAGCSASTDSSRETSFHFTCSPLE